MRIPRTNFSTAALYEANHVDDFEDPHPGASAGAPAQATSAAEHDHLFEAPEAPRRTAGPQAHDEAYAGRAARLYGHGSAYAPAQVTAATDDPLPTLAEITGQGDGSSWESHFFLSPNVRFTRTPEREFLKRRAPAADESEVEPEENEVAAGETSEPTVTEAAPTEVVPAAEVLPAEIEAPSYSPSELLRVLMQQLPSWSAAQARDGHAVEPAAAATPAAVENVGLASLKATAVAAGEEATADVPTDGATLADNAADVAAPLQSDGRLAYLSDFAFFEFMPLGEAPVPAAASLARQIVQAPAPVAAAPQPVAPPPVEIRPLPPTAITALFRVVECRRPEPGAAVPVPEAPQSGAAVAANDAASMLVVSPARALAEPVLPAPAPAAEPAPQAPVTKAAITMPAVVQRSASAFPPIGTTDKRHGGDSYEFPSKELLQEPPQGQGFFMTQEQLEQNAGLLESVLEDFGVKGEIIHVRPGPVVTLYEFEPAPGVKSSRVIGLADDIARSMSALSARVAVVPGRNVIGIELPNATRETVYFRELIESNDFLKTGCKLALCLGKTIGGEPVIAELAKMPHLLVAGTTGSGKSVAINTMILSLLYRLKPEECRLIMVDPKMLELSVYDGIPHLLTPVVTDPKKAVMALKWAVREMEDRYRKMSRLGVRNIDGYNQRAAAAREKGEPILATVQTGFEKGTGEPLFEQQEMDLSPMPYIVVIVDEMADLMMVAGKEIEGAIQRLAQMARAAGIHLIMATQRPSVDVITGTIKANFPTRISFQVTSKIDSRTILGEQGAEQLLGQGDMLHMAGGGRIARVHGPFVSDQEVEHVVAHLKTQGRPEYLETVTADEEEEEPEEEQGAVFDKGAIAAEDGNELYEQAVKVVLRDKKCSTSYIQRRLGIGYNRAASLVERMEKEGLVGPANHVGKREIIYGNRDQAAKPDEGDMD
ncbi:DNA translocase FtsK [Sinorhizobium saheli]|uniref:Cell division protein FtsK n=1 Tax=Sinorhizobium saheli TaxID=36856 RepID=A0A178YSF6_SINSA|nr:DNA translocase FtsK [Sinorhizobium saheli]MQW90122.1 DNA translocase FtsK [Sinorhizobium saheli]OAP50488.1 cell division protein FtsK [Sinorhizobium saheli]